MLVAVLPCVDKLVVELATEAEDPTAEPAAVSYFVKPCVEIKLFNLPP